MFAKAHRERKMEFDLTGAFRRKAMNNMVSWAHLVRFCAAFLTISWFLLCGTALANMRYCNKSAMPIATAVTYLDNSDRWVTEGWWTIWPGDCASVAPIYNRYIAVRAQVPGNVFAWTGKTKKYCVTNRAFRRYTQDECGSDFKDFAEFFNVDTGGATDFTYSFTCDTCRLPAFKFNQDKLTAFVYYVAEYNEGAIKYYVPASGYFSFSLNEPGRFSQSIHVVADLYVDLADVQRKFTSLAASQVNYGDDCNELLILNSASITSSGSEASTHANATYEQWACPTVTVPQVRCEDTWITIGPLKTKGVPSCTTYMGDTQVTKTKIFQQSGDIDIALRPILTDSTSISIQGEVTGVRLDGFGQAIADLFQVNLKDRAQNLLDSTLNNGTLSFSAPEELKDYMAFQSVVFDNSGSASGLGLHAHGEFDVTGTQILSLCRKFWPEGKCTRQ
jgi:uncharacterized membrane protein